MNRTREQLKAAKAKKDWERLQEALIEEETSNKPKLKKVKNVTKEDSRRDSA